MIRKNFTLHKSNASFTSSLDLSRIRGIRNSLVHRQRINQSSEANNSTLNNNRNRNNITTQVNESTRIIPIDENNSLISNLSNNIYTHNNPIITNANISSPSDNNRQFKKIGKQKLSRDLINKNDLNEIKEEEKQKEENITSELKDTVKCYICFDIITKPKMCPHCHRIACEKCLYNWFMIEQKKNCGFCRKNVNFYEMVSVPFMSTVVDFVEKVFEKDKNGEIKFSEKFQEFCPNHANEKLYYYCLDCDRGYCQTCFVFFGEEKDRHVSHNIIEYEQYKNLNFTSLKSYEDKINSNIDKIDKNIQRCISYKNSYEFERNEGNKLIEKLKNEFNQQIDINLRIIEEEMNKLQKHKENYEKYKIELNNYYNELSNKNSNKLNIYSCQKISQKLINKLSSLTAKKLFSSKEIENLMDISRRMEVRTYQSKLGEFNHETIFLSKNLKMGDSPYQLVIDNKQRNEVDIKLIIPKNKITFGHNFLPFIFIKKKGSEVATYELEEAKEDNNNFYYRKKIPWDYFGESVFKIKGILYDYYFL